MTMDPNMLVVPGQAGAWLMANDKRAAESSTNEGLEQWADEFVVKVDAIIEGMGIKLNPDPRKRLIGYLLKPQILWDEQAQKFPRDFEEDWADYQKLRARAEKGDFRDAGS